VNQGFNHNIRHKDLLFHVQTEDMGAKIAYVVTTLFHDGNVVALRRSSYKKFLKVQNLDEIVLTIMKEQHKDMMKDLINDRLRAATLLISEKQHGGATKIPPVATPSSGAPVEQPSVGPTLEADGKREKTLDELILEFLNSESQK
jgi:hypothetical protein